MIIFATPGELDVRAIKTFGVSSKADKKTAIGYFGTGLKYAIAILLRLQQEIEIITGGKSYKFGIKRSKIRFDEFDIVTMNGEELGFTTELGKQWELWMAFRELYSNTLDEKGSILTEQKVSKDTTYIVVTGNDFEEIYEERDKYFLNKEIRTPLEVSCGVEAYDKMPGEIKGTLFYKGIKAGETPSVGLYDYNFVNGQALSEDRSIKNAWNINWQLAALVLNSKSQRFITNMVLAADVHEEEFNYRICTREPDISFFLTIVGDLRKRLCDTGINPTAIQLHAQETKVETVLPTKSCKLNKIEAEQLTRAVTFCKETLELDIDDYKLIVCKHLGKDENLGRADMVEGIMYISKQCFKEGTKRVATSILEEYTHCKHKVLDETVGQKWVYLNQILSLGERIQGEPL